MYSTFITRHSVWQGLWDQLLSFQTALTSMSVRVETMQGEINELRNTAFGGPPSDAGSVPPRHYRIAAHHTSGPSSRSSGSPLAFPVAPLALSQGEYENSDSSSSAASAATAERRQPRPLTREPAHSDIFHPMHVSGLYGSGSSSPLPPRHRRALRREGALVLSAGSSSGRHRSRARFANSASAPFSSLHPPLLPVSGPTSASASGSASNSTGSGSSSTGSRKRARDAGSGSDSGNSGADAHAQEGRRVRQRGSSSSRSIGSPTARPGPPPTSVRTLKRTREDDGADDGARKRARTFMEVVLGPSPSADGAVSAALLPSPPSLSAPSPPSLSAPPRAPSPSAARSSSPAPQPRLTSAGGTPRRRSARLMARSDS
ncbi:hypothetical protein HWV62_12779 [Athelia sp. TMB]|nr:hypothetical protein HWV62_12779 [Athelia sp. TMB]